jgi:predicted O-methyltransferase YrrM
MDSCELFQLATDFSDRAGYWGSGLAFIYGLAVGSRARHMLEIGVWHGGSTRALLLAAAVNGGHVTSIDIDDCEGAVPAASRVNWTFIRGDSRIVLPTIDFPIDLALIDGEHSFDAVSNELKEIDRLMVSRGCIVLDDCWATSQGVLDAFQSFGSTRRIEKTLIHYGTHQSLEGTDRTLGLIRYK